MVLIAKSLIFSRKKIKILVIEIKSRKLVLPALIAQCSLFITESRD